MAWQTIVAIIGFLTGLAALGGVTWGLGLRWGEVRAQLKTLSDTKLLERLTKLETKQGILWEVFSTDILHNRPHLGSATSPFTPSPQAQDALEAVKKALRPHCRQDEKEIDCLSTPDAANLADKVLVELPHRIGLQTLREIAHKNQMSLAELLALVSLEVESL